MQTRPTSIKFQYRLTAIACCCFASFCACVCVCVRNSADKQPNERSRVEPDLGKLTQSVQKFSIPGYLANNLGAAASNLPKALKSNWSLPGQRRSGKSSTKDQPLWLSNWKKDIAETSSEERCICESVCWLQTEGNWRWGWYKWVSCPRIRQSKLRQWL